MTQLYQDKEIKQAFEQRNKLLLFYFCLLALFLAASVLLVVFQNRHIAFYMATANIIISVAFCFFTLFYFTLKFRPVKKYCKMLKFFSQGIKENSSGEFLRYDMQIQEKEGVECVAMILRMPSIKSDEIFMERKVLIDKTRELPQINEGQRISFVAQGNILLAFAFAEELPKKQKSSAINLGGQ